MVEILRANRGTIHSFAEFRTHVQCPAPLLVILIPALQLASPTDALTPSQRAELARSQVRGSTARRAGSAGNSGSSSGGPRSR